ncbi:MAG: phosphoribosylamine--glycine ligase [Ignavibacteria bacterium]|nr:phosphoribosylamine--glycine ligase [Ignavibacteria bacterium]
MNVLLIGSGGREHALAWRLKLSTTRIRIFSPSNNSGILSLAEHIPIDESNYPALAKFCIEQNIDLVVVGPEAPLANGITDILSKEKILVFGPSKLASKIESSKAFAKEFMKRNSIPTANFEIFTKDQEERAIDFVKNANFPLVIKADGLASGKGVVIAENFEDAKEKIRWMFAGAFGHSGFTIVLEEYLEGDEASVLAITDGSDYILLPSAQDHKKILEGEKGKNTGGMGAYSPTPLVTKPLLKQIEEEIILPTIKGMANEGYPFVGCLYAGLMIKDGKAKVLEFNCRFGDPETQAILPLVNGDFFELLASAAQGKLNKNCVNVIENKFVSCVIIASKGYPDLYEKGFEISGIRKAESLGCLVFHSGTLEKGGKIVTNGGRVLGVCGIGNSLADSIHNAYTGVNEIYFENMYYRRDIGAKGLKYQTT